jgi:transposase-like protein
MVSMEEQKKRRTRRKFTEEFKARAVRLVLKEGRTVAQVGRDLDLAESVLHSWVRQAKIDRGMGPPGALIIAGSPLIALEHLEAPFSKVILCDLDEENVQTLRARTARFGDRARVFPGDCNKVVDQIVADIPPYGFNIALLDPFGVDQLQFETIDRLAAIKRMDLILHFPTMDMKRERGSERGEGRPLPGSGGRERSCR